MAEVTNRRSGYFIDRPFQGKFIAVGLAGLATLAVGSLVLWGSQMSSATQMSPGAQSGISVEVVMLLVLILALVVVTVMFGLRFSHRIIGPIYAFNRHLNWIREGNYSRDLKLRQGDEFQNLMTTFNATQSALRRRTRENIETLDRALRALTELEHAAPDAKPVAEELRREIAEVKKREESVLAG
ncbi:MAG: hypothetical protein IT350_06370 [Deltaproteobacteria bacterium]|nr:hypothetical protein [Deltaproteobacteria bacterium]